MNFETRPTMLLEWKFCLKNAEVTVQREDDKKQLLGTDSWNGLAEGKKNPHRHEPKFPGPHLDCHMLVRVQWDVPSVPPECQHAEITGFPGGSDGKGFARKAGDPGSVPGSGRSPGEGNATHSSTLAWRISPSEEPGRLQSTGSQKSQTRLGN